MLYVENHGPLITATNFWTLPAEAAGKILVSVNAGAIRILMPRSKRPMIEDMRASQYAILSRGPWPQVGLSEAVEILFEDGTDSPFMLHLAAETFDLLPGEPEAGREWVLAVYDEKKGKPHKAVERKCHWRRAPSIPWMKPWEPK